MLALFCALTAFPMTLFAAPQSGQRDSAGIRMIDVALPRAGTPTTWQLESASLVIGDGQDNDHELARIQGAVQLSDGSILVIDSRPIQIRQYSSSGALQARIGRVGSGPGEFRMIANYQPLPADSVMIFDRALRRVSIIGGTRSPGVRSLPFAPATSQQFPMGLHTVLGQMTDGYVAMGAAKGPATGSGLSTPRFRLVVLRPLLDSGVMVGEFDGDDLYFANARGGQTCLLGQKGSSWRGRTNGESIVMTAWANSELC